METKESIELKKKYTLEWPKVAIIILNWNGWKDTIECLESVFRNTYSNYQVIVIDNGSTDGSMEKIKAWAEGKQEVLTPEPSHPLYHLSHPAVKKPIPYIWYTREQAEKGGSIKLEEKVIKEWQEQRKNNGKEFNPTSSYPLIFIQTGENLGFAGGNNIGIKKALNNDAKYILLLNNDTLVKKDFLRFAILSAESNNRIGIVGPKICYLNKPDVIWFGGGKIVWPIGFHYHIGNKKNKPQFCKPLYVDFVTGACMLIKRKLIQEIGLLREFYFMQWEDIDFCASAINNGYKCLYFPDSLIWHGSSSSYNRMHISNIKIKFSCRNRIIFFKKHLSKAHYFLIIPFWLFLMFPIYLLYYFVKYKNIFIIFEGIKGIIKGLLWKNKSGHKRKSYKF